VSHYATDVLRRKRDSFYIAINNPHALASHLQCAAHEAPLGSIVNDSDLWGVGYAASIASLVKDRSLSKSVSSSGDFVYSCRTETPSKGVNIRETDTDTFVLVDESRGGKQIDSMGSAIFLVVVD
jgi:ATP-dependent helicase YprA (DUF1998 family)